MQSLTAVVLGATGMIGELLVQQLLADPGFSKVRILVRRPLQISHAKLEMVVTNFSNLNEYKNNIGAGDCIFCCIGTTMRQVKGDKVLYRSIDYDIPVNAAKFGKAAGFTSYLLVSAVGANASASNFYLKLKGEVEKAILDISYKATHIFQPSILLGKRKEFRLGETIGKGIMQFFSPLFLGGTKKFRGIQALDVAKAMVNASKQNKAGSFIYQYLAISKLAHQAH